MIIIERTHNIQNDEIVDVERNATAAELAEIKELETKLAAAEKSREEAQLKREALLAKLGITEDEAKLLLS